MTISDQMSYSKIETLRGKNPTEIHGALSEVCGEFTVDRSTVSGWANRFRGGCVRIDNDPRPGRPRISTDDRTVKPMADSLEENLRATCQALSRANESQNVTGKCTRTDLSCTWLGQSFSMKMFARTSQML